MTSSVNSYILYYINEVNVMAIFIPHIKGCEENGNIYTWIKWQGRFSDGSSDNHFQTPKIEVKDTRDITTTNTDLGYIITSGADRQKINKTISIPNIQEITKLDFSSVGSIQPISNNTILQFLGAENKKVEIKSLTELNLYGATKTYLQANTANTSINLASNDTFSTIIYKAAEHNFAKGYVVIGDDGSTDKTDGSLYIKNSCNALYFNARSDIRAKTNLQHASFKALNIVKSLPVYTFTYKETGSPSIGLIAQDAAKISFGSDFSLVNNENASGENGDYMTIKESKLIYILWKAIQEQQEQINYLTSLVKDLSRK